MDLRGIKCQGAWEICMMSSVICYMYKLNTVLLSFLPVLDNNDQQWQINTTLINSTWLSVYKLRVLYEIGKVCILLYSGITAIFTQRILALII